MRAPFLQFSPGIKQEAEIEEAVIGKTDEEQTSEQPWDESELDAWNSFGEDLSDALVAEEEIDLEDTDHEFGLADEWDADEKYDETEEEIEEAEPEEEEFVEEREDDEERTSTSSYLQKTMQPDAATLNVSWKSAKSRRLDSNSSRERIRQLFPRRPRTVLSCSSPATTIAITMTTTATSRAIAPGLSSAKQSSKATIRLCSCGSASRRDGCSSIAGRKVCGS